MSASIATCDEIGSHLYSLLRSLERPEERPSYLSSVSGLSSLSQLVRSSFPIARGAGNGITLKGLGTVDANSLWEIHSFEELYNRNLLKECIMTQFQLLCVSKELEEEVEQEQVAHACKEIVEAAELYNDRCAASWKQRKKRVSYAFLAKGMPHYNWIWFADFVETFVRCNSERVAAQFLSETCSANRVLAAARKASGIIRMLISISYSHSSLLCDVSVAPIVSVQPVPTRLQTPSYQNPSTNSSRKIQQASTPQQQTVLRTESLVASQFWKEVFLHLRTRVQRKVKVGGGGDGDYVQQFAAIAQGLPTTPDLEAVAKCLQFTSISLSMDEALTQWDAGFQGMLAAACKPPRGNKPCRSVPFLCSSVLPPLTTATMLPSTSPDFPTTTTALADYADRLRHFQCLSWPLVLSIHTISRTLISRLEMGMAYGKLSTLSRLLFEDAPRVCDAIGPVVSQVQQVLAPTVVFPTYSRFHLEQQRSLADCIALVQCRDSMNEELGRICLRFYESLRQRCRKCIQSAFPPVKHWKNMAKKGGAHTARQPSAYCDVMVEQLLLPIAEAALPLEETAQQSCMVLCTCILLAEHRRAIISNTHAYKLTAVRQLLADLRHLSQWLCSERLGLAPATLHTLPTLPIMTEMEQGLLGVCTCGSQSGEGSRSASQAGEEQLPQSVSGGGRRVMAELLSQPIPGLSRLPLWSELAHHSASDWANCTL